VHLGAPRGRRGARALTPAQEMDEDANILDVRFTKSVIASKEAFTYEAAQLRKDDLYVLAPRCCVPLTRA
jgi:hypothetical protein